jgi:O-antigen ligase
LAGALVYLIPWRLPKGKRAVKWIFLIALLFVTPALAALLKSERKWIPHAAFALALLPFLESEFNIVASPVSWPTWPGHAKGIDASFVDAVAIAMILATHRVSTPLILKVTFAFYLVVYSFTTLIAQSAIPAVFYGWQLARLVLVFYAISRATAMSPKVPVAILTGLIVGLCTQAGAAFLQWVGGNPRAGGWFGHSNLLGMVSHFAVFPAFAVFLGGHYSRRAALAVFAALVIAFAGGSRATIGLIAMGLVATAALSIWYRSSGRKAAVAGLGVLVLIASSPLLYSAIERRDAETRAQSSEERVKMESAARMIMADYPLGVGSNNYVMVANLGGYSARAGVPWSADNRAAPVHNAYYLIAAEMGVVGLIAFLAVLGSIFTLAVTTFRRSPPSFTSDYVLGTVIAIGLVATHSYVEWVLMLFPVHMLIALTAGLIVGVRAARTSEVQAARSRPAEPARSALAAQ